MSRVILYKFRLYIAGGTQNSTIAAANLAEICRAYLVDRCEIEVVDVFREPQRALADSIFMTPTLVRLVPHPPIKIVGTLTQSKPVLQALGLDPVGA